MDYRFKVTRQVSVNYHGECMDTDRITGGDDCGGQCEGHMGWRGEKRKYVSDMQSEAEPRKSEGLSIDAEGL